MSRNALAFYLDAPLQAWGASSRYQIRDTDAFPTKSGVLGMIAAAMGIDKEDPREEERVAELAALRFSAKRVYTQNRADVGRLMDFHTVGGGYDTDKGSGERLFVTRKASGAPFGTVITKRSYLTDAKFIVCLQRDATLLAACADALENPVWGVWFGRKACLPAAPLAPTLADTIEKALEDLRSKMPSPIELDVDGRVEEPGDGAWHVMDDPVSFGKRTYRSRPVKRG